ncbi:UPF0332 protein [Bacteroidia bacterium]|nr:UPF0332 protein [Bacteroidia bacterium]
MKLTDEQRKPIVDLYFEKANETMSDALLLVNAQRWQGAVNRLYYACYNAVRALLMYNGIHANTHAGVRSQFGLNFVTTKKIDNQYNKFYSKLFELRQTGDYDVFSEITEKDVVPLVSLAEDFIQTIEKLISTKQTCQK